jgi:hypothetical protein
MSWLSLSLSCGGLGVKTQYNATLKKRSRTHPAERLGMSPRFKFSQRLGDLKMSISAFSQ